MRIFVLIVCSLGFVSLMACESKKERHEEMMIQTPLALDPTDNIELSRWWTNGKELLLLDGDGFYSICEGPGRHSAELERGRWTQQNYATLWLEPYRAASSPRVRVHVTKSDGALALLVPRYETFKPINSPPVTMDDQLIGRWLGSIGELRLMSTHRYELVPADRPGGGAAPGAGALPPVIERGTWGVTGGELALQADKSTAAPMILKIVADDKHVVLNASGSGGVLTKAASPASGL